MKNNIIIIALSLILFSSCSDFLEERSHDRIVPKTVQDYSEMLYGEAYPREHDEFVKYIELMTDDVKDVYITSSQETRADGWGYYTWQQDPQSRKNGSVFIDNTWANFYKYILSCNIVINDINNNNVKGNIKDIQDLKAEAHFLKAWYYLTLVNLFGEPYDPATASTALGIPLNNLNEATDLKFKRETLAKVYEQIEGDILESIKLFETSKKAKTVFRANINAAYLLASRIFLYEQKWKEAKKYADLLLDNKSSLYDYSSKNNIKWWYGINGSIITKKSPEILFTYADASLTFFPEDGATGYFKQSDDLFSSFDANDNRKIASFPSKSSYSWSLKPVVKKHGKPEETGVYGFAFRTAEAYLNRAEALCHIEGKYTEGLKDINYLREFRYKKDNLKLATATSPKTALDTLRKERRLELCFEGFRWFDLRRWDRPEIEHFYTSSNFGGATGETFVLQKNDPAYTLPLPSYIRDINMDIKRISRPERTAK